MVRQEDCQEGESRNRVGAPPSRGFVRPYSRRGHARAPHREVSVPGIRAPLAHRRASGIVRATPGGLRPLFNGLACRTPGRIMPLYGVRAVGIILPAPTNGPLL